MKNKHGVKMPKDRYKKPSRSDYKLPKKSAPKAKKTYSGK